MAHLVWDEMVAGSNPASPTSFKEGPIVHWLGCRLVTAVRLVRFPLGPPVLILLNIAAVLIEIIRLQENLDKDQKVVDFTKSVKYHDSHGLG